MLRPNVFTVLTKGSETLDVDSAISVLKVGIEAGEGNKGGRTGGWLMLAPVGVLDDEDG